MGDFDLSQQCRGDRLHRQQRFRSDSPQRWSIPGSGFDGTKEGHHSWKASIKLDIERQRLDIARLRPVRSLLPGQSSISPDSIVMTLPGRGLMVSTFARSSQLAVERTIARWPAWYREWMDRLIDCGAKR